MSFRNHLCHGDWKEGKVDGCALHQHIGVPAPDVRPFDSRRKNTVTVGVAKTGQISPKGTVSHTEDWEGRVAATAQPAPVQIKLNEQDWFRNKWTWKNNRWVSIQTGKEMKWQPSMVL